MQNWQQNKRKKQEIIISLSKKSPITTGRETCIEDFLKWMKIYSSI